MNLKAKPSLDLIWLLGYHLKSVLIKGQPRSEFWTVFNHLSPGAIVQNLLQGQEILAICVKTFCTFW